MAALRLPACPEVKISVSIGGTQRSGSLNAQLLHAEKALYRAKEKKNAVEVSE